jgi:hypothetical protein
VDRRLDRGGRFYGPWYQGIPEEYRAKILINGNPTLEIDYSGYHPRILYALKGLTLPEDPYNLEEYPQTEEMRKFLKGMLLSIVNAKDEKDACAGIRGQRFDDIKKAKRWGIEVKPIGIEPLTNERLLPVMKQLMERHKPIEEFFYSEKGSYLQWLDSQIAEAVMLYFADTFNQPCLPIHDSFIVDFRLLGFLEDIMQAYFEQALKQKIIVKKDLNGLLDSGEKVNKVLKKSTKQIIAHFREDLKDYPKNKDRIHSFLKEGQELIARARELLGKEKIEK